MWWRLKIFCFSLNADIFLFLSYFIWLYLFPCLLHISKLCYAFPAISAPIQTLCWVSRFIRLGKWDIKEQGCHQATKKSAKLYLMPKILSSLVLGFRSWFIRIIHLACSFTYWEFFAIPRFHYKEIRSHQAPEALHDLLQKRILFID